MKLALIVFMMVVLCSGCAVNHLDPPERLGNTPTPRLVNVPENTELETDATTAAATRTVDVPTVSNPLANEADARSSDIGARLWRVDEKPDPWFAKLEASSQLSLASSDSAAGGTSESSPPPFNPFSKAYVGLVWDDIKATFTAPAQWDARDWLIFGGVVASVGTVAVFDEDIQRAVQRNRNKTTDDFANAVQGFGNQYAPGVIGAFYFGGLLFDNPQAKSVALDATSASIIASGLILYPVKYAVGRARPGANHGAYDFSPFSGSDSFPSGHTTEAFTLATVISEHYDSIWIDVGCYGIASAVGYARLDLNYHWASDVLAGAAIGTFVGHVVVHVNHNRWGVSLAPVIGPGMNGAQLSWAF